MNFLICANFFIHFRKFKKFNFLLRKKCHHFSTFFQIIFYAIYHWKWINFPKKACIFGLFTLNIFMDRSSFKCFQIYHFLIKNVILFSHFLNQFCMFSFSFNILLHFFGIFTFFSAYSAAFWTNYNLKKIGFY